MTLNILGTAAEILKCLSHLNDSETEVLWVFTP